MKVSNYMGFPSIYCGLSNIREYRCHDLVGFYVHEVVEQIDRGPSDLVNVFGFLGESKSRPEVLCRFG